MRRWAVALLLTIGSVGAAKDPTSNSITGIILDGEAQQGGVLIGTAPAATAELRLDDQPVRFDRDGRFLIAFDRDAKPQARLTARLADGHMLSQIINVAPRAWRIERVNTALRPVRDNEAYLALRRPELARIAAARSVDTGATGWRQRFLWPGSAVFPDCSDRSAFTKACRAPIMAASMSRGRPEIQSLLLPTASWFWPLIGHSRLRAIC